MDSILLIDDSKTQALRIAHFLEQNGYAVDCAHTAAEAFGKIRASLPDMIITDYHMPGMFGDEVCRRLRVDKTTEAIPVLMLTSEKTVEIEELAFNSGADEYINKSELEDILPARVQTLFRKYREKGPDKIHSSGNRILVVDDSDTYREYVAMQLQRESYEVETAATGSVALQRIANGEGLDGVVLDMILPDMQGIKMCQQFVSLRESLQLSFTLLMLTGGEDPKEMNAVLAAGADDVVGKSKDFRIISARLRANIRRRCSPAG